MNSRLCLLYSLVRFIIKSLTVADQPVRKHKVSAWFPDIRIIGPVLNIIYYFIPLNLGYGETVNCHLNSLWSVHREISLKMKTPTTHVVLRTTFLLKPTKFQEYTTVVLFGGDAGVTPMVQYYCADLTVCKCSFIATILWGAIKNI